MLSLTPNQLSKSYNGRSWESEMRKITTIDYRVGENLSEYCKHVNEVTVCCEQVIKLPGISLQNPADWYTTEFINNYARMKGNMHRWTNVILIDLYSVPQAVLHFCDLYVDQEKELIAICKLLVDNPKDSEKKKYLYEQLEFLQTQAKSKCDQVTDVYDAILDFQNNVKEAEGFFSTLYDNSSDTKKADQKKVDDYQKKVDELNDDIRKWSDVQEGMLIAEGIETTIVTISLACGPVGLLVGIITGVGMIAEGITAVVADEKIKEDGQELKRYQAEMEPYSKDAATLKDLIEKLQKVKVLLEQSMTALQSICGAWKQVNDNTSIFLSTIKKMESDEQKGLFRVVRDSLLSDSKQMAELQKVVKMTELKAHTKIEEGIYEAKLA